MKEETGLCRGILRALTDKLRTEGRMPQPEEMGVSPSDLARCLEMALDHGFPTPEPSPQPPPPAPPVPETAPTLAKSGRPVKEGLILHADGGSRGNPGPAGAGAVLTAQDGRQVAGLSRFLGIATNNVAEYQGLIMGLEAALAQGARRLQVYMDSELLVRQMIGRYQVKAPHLKPLYQQARALAARFESIAFTHVPRAENAQADALANQAMDRRG